MSVRIGILISVGQQSRAYTSQGQTTKEKLLSPSMNPSGITDINPATWCPVVQPGGCEAGFDDTDEERPTPTVWHLVDGEAEPTAESERSLPQEVSSGDDWTPTILLVAQARERVQCQPRPADALQFYGRHSVANLSYKPGAIIHAKI